MRSQTKSVTGGVSYSSLPSTTSSYSALSNSSSKASAAIHIRHRLRCSRELAADLLPGRNGIRILHRPGFRRSHLMAASNIFMLAGREDGQDGTDQFTVIVQGQGYGCSSGWINQGCSRIRRYRRNRCMRCFPDHS